MVIVFLALLLAAGFAAALFWIPRLIDRRTERFQSDLVNRHYEEVENMYRVMRSSRRPSPGWSLAGMTSWPNI